MWILWTVIGIAAWFSVSCGVGLVIGGVLRMRDLGTDRPDGPAEQPESTWADCRCGHARAVHEHEMFPWDTWCGQCRCVRWSAVDGAVARQRHRLVRTWWTGRPSTAA